MAEYVTLLLSEVWLGILERERKREMKCAVSMSGVSGCVLSFRVYL